ncbi:protein phosphatase 1 regulatory subunit 12C isoform X2 [Anolis carolinensis]|uniref:protein phosphatase 1 regulatory subunit 12C isoform X2 n=1 Tax=Anolis carolinensis TaxID=28377 RepID=UPI000462A847|nr:PREDICTED: protein phosphatase 1 regulatory subunit 12C isoform X2 [Anolis carolinensis]|eukprot:XP_008116678.1 PREDICTED: protein phosphatase 1 regulatory subunit 12C isoform X2 [Anolis carolinensis]
MATPLLSLSEGEGARARRREQLRAWAEAEAEAAAATTEKAAAPAAAPGSAPPPSSPSPAGFKASPEAGSERRRRQRRPRVVRFEAAAEFLACCAGAELEAAKEMLAADPGAVNGTNADGISALHQACIDENMEVVEFLVMNGADVNQADNEGWTPLHVAASCDYIEIAQYLLDHGANIAAVNSDGDVPLDIAEADNMEALLRSEIGKRGVDVEVAKREEEEIMLRDARQWLNAGKISDESHPKTGATALHVAAAKGYIEVMRLLLQAGYEPNVRDKDGWAPLHAAAHWGVEEACRLLAEHFCDMEALNNVGQRPCDLADEDTLALLEELQHKQNDLRSKKEAHLMQAVIDTSLEQPPSYTSKHRRSSVCRMSSKEKISVQDQSKERKTLGTIAVGEEETSSASEGEETPDTNEVKTTPVTDSSAVNGVSVIPITPLSPSPTGQKFSGGSSRTMEPEDAAAPAIWRQSLRKTSSFGVLQDARLEDGAAKEGSGIKRSASSPRLDTEEKQDIRELLQKWNKNPIGPGLAHRSAASESAADPSKEPRLARVTPTPTRRIFALPDTEPHRDPRRANLEGGLQMKIDTALVPHQSLSSTAISSGMDPQDRRRSYQTPVRDEESESQRKARSRLMRQSRRSTQGVTLTDLKEAEKTMGRTGDSKTMSEQRSKEDEKHDKDEEQHAQESTDSSRRFRLSSSDSASVYTVNPLVVNSQPRKGSEADETGSEADTDLRNRLAIRDRRKGRRERRITGLGGNSEGEDDEDAEQVNNEDPSGHGSEHLNNLLPNRTAPYSCQRRNSASSGCKEEPDHYYKKLYEDLSIENEKLKEQLQEAQLQLTQIKLELERVTQRQERFAERPALLELERFERRALERKAAELEEELKALSDLKADNQRLKDENAALIRVISKLSK